ncbi:MAG TPA: glycosyltransferase family 2 protein [Bacteroidales bacterium]|nr:glycosyltransferase family 2 protein [Bacteroidales bacterium]
MPKITAIIITYNEEEYIGRCLESIKGIVDEIIVVDSFSTDKTEEICNKYNVRFIKHKFEGYRDQKNYALKHATYPNILSLDADEALSDTLRESILSIKDMDRWDYDGYKFNRKNYYCGKWIKYSDWYPDRQLRLFFADHGQFGELNLHEKFILSNGARIGRLKGDLLHLAFLSEKEHLDKMEKYAHLGATEYHRTGRKASLITPFVHAAWGFFRKYFIRGGFLDGKDGYNICSVYARSAFKKYRMLYKLNRTKKNKN